MQWGFTCVAVLVISEVIWDWVRAYTALKSWAKTNGFEILQSESRSLLRGPFANTLHYNCGPSVWYVKVRTRKGAEKTAWVRCGYWLCGFCPIETEVKWEK